ncbi:hypothetical protein MPDQ_001143 [Monascus purpureus]|uniref:Mechanosensitive ion channel protein n=1 Tax=Monascus purpureus TaxID=5098 RepID=A0A507R0N3_MONPU|nr:hypothetical protein MPDQ_001143 [Monascus purpureus]BDD61462.1 hypothetical protein MAP00_006506 [Monascus purpureus]
MSTPLESPAKEHPSTQQPAAYDDQQTFVNDNPTENGDNRKLKVDTTHSNNADELRSPSRDRERALRLGDDLAVLEAEREASRSLHDEEGTAEEPGEKGSFSSRSHSRHVDEFDEVTNPLHEKAAAFNPPENPTTDFAKFVKRIHNSSFIIRYATYIIPVVVLLLIPLLVGALKFKDANVGGVRLLWFSVWLEIFWLTLWAGRVVAKCIPPAVGILASVFTNNAKKWRDMAEQLEFPATLFFWWLGVEISFLPTMINHHVDGGGTRHWERTVNKIIVSIFVWTILNLVEKVMIQLIAMNFHLRTYSDRIEVNKFQIGSLTKLYAYSTAKLGDKDEDFEEKRNGSESGGMKTPMQYAGLAQKMARGALNKVGDVAGAVAADFTGRKANKSTHPHQVVLTLLRTPSGSQVLARRLYRTFVRKGQEVILADDLKIVFDNEEEAEAAFIMFDKDLNGDISMEELEAVCVEVGRERKAITASLKDLDSVVSKLDHVFDVLVFVIVVMVFLSLISTSASGVLTSAGSFILGLSWLFSATAQEFLQSIVFVFVKHPFDVGDRVTIYGNSGDTGRGDDYFVKQVSLLYTEFKKMQGHIVQAPNSYLNTLFILNQRRSGALAEAVPVIIKYGTTLEQMEALRQRLLEFVRSENREFQNMILTELREVTENFSVTLNVVFFYKSNWQNEGLRLQRRNKFICMLMVALQEIGIEGPRMNLQGAAVDIPFHVTYNGIPSGTSAGPSGNNGFTPATPVGGDMDTIPEESGQGSALRSHPSILRKGMHTAAARARGESIASHKHVDFSLGMRNVSSADVMGDVFDDRGVSKVDDVILSANREAEDLRRQRLAEEREAEEERSRSSMSKSHRRGSNLSSHPGASEGRRSMDTHSHRSVDAPSHRSLSIVHPNRFLRTRTSPDIEQGSFDSGAPGSSDMPKHMYVAASPSRQS